MSFGRSLVEQLRQGEDQRFRQMMALQSMLHQQKQFDFQQSQAGEAARRAEETERYRRDREAKLDEDKLRDDDTKVLQLRSSIYSQLLGQGYKRHDALTESGMLSGRPWTEDEITRLAAPSVAAENTKRIGGRTNKPGQVMDPAQMMRAPEAAPRPEGMDLLESLLPAVTGAVGIPMPEIPSAAGPSHPVSFGGRLEEPQMELGYSPATAGEVLDDPSPKFTEQLRKQQEMEKIRASHEQAYAKRAEAYRDRVTNDKVYQAASVRVREKANEIRQQITNVNQEYKRGMLRNAEGRLELAKSRDQWQKLAAQTRTKLDPLYRPVNALYQRFTNWEHEAQKHLKEAEAALAAGEPQPPTMRLGDQVVPNYEDQAYKSRVSHFVKMEAQKQAALDMITEIQSDETYDLIMGEVDPYTSMRVPGTGLWAEVSGLWERTGNPGGAAAPSLPAAPTRRSTTGSSTKQLTREAATAILKEAGGDKNKARELARKRGFTF